MPIQSQEINTFNLDNLLFYQLGCKASDYIHAMLAYWDKAGVCRFANASYLERFNLKNDVAVTTLSQRVLLGEDGYASQLPYMEAVLTGFNQIYERIEINAAGAVGHYITSYYSHVVLNETAGYFVHITDVTPIKNLEKKIIELEKAKERELLRSFIETQEMDKEAVAYQLTDSVNQTLAYCKVMLEKASEEQLDNPFLKKFSTYIQQAIGELNTLGNKMSPSVIKLLGFTAGVKDFLDTYIGKQYPQIHFECKNEEIEKIDNTHKIALFRIIQDYLLMLDGYTEASHIAITVNYLHPNATILLTHNDALFEIPRKGKEYLDINNRVQYYGGNIVETKSKGMVTLEILLQNIP